MSIERDREFMEALLKGDNRAWEKMSECVEKWLINASRRHRIQDMDLEDHRQEIISKLVENNYKKLQQFSFRCRLSSWAGSIVNFHMYSHYTTEIRRERRETGFYEIQKEFAESEGSESRLIESIDSKEIVETAITQLSESDQKIIRQVYWDGLMPKEISRITGETNSTVTSRLSRARSRLKDILIANQQLDKEGKVV